MKPDLGAKIQEQLGHYSEKFSSLSMLLRKSDLPEGRWRIVGEVFSKSGLEGVGQADPRIRRRNNAGLYIAKRSYEQRSPRQSVIPTIIPYVSAMDARESVTEIKNFTVPNPRASGVVVEQSILTNLNIPGVEDTDVTETIRMADYGRVVTRYIAGSVENILFFIVSSKRGDDWDWSESIGVATRQAQRIQEILLKQRNR